MDEKFVEGVLRELSKGRRSGGPSSVHSGPGVYAIFAKGLSCLPGIVLPSEGLEKGLVYIGQTKNVKTRNHFNQTRSGTSTLRRSIGSILKMKGKPSKNGGKKAEYRNFRFDDSDEKRLNEWMHSNLEYSFYQFNEDSEIRKNLESLLIANYKPSLNLTLTLWRTDDQKRKIMGLRDECKEEAKRKWDEAKENA